MFGIELSLQNCTMNYWTQSGGGFCSNKKYPENLIGSGPGPAPLGIEKEKWKQLAAARRQKYQGTADGHVIRPVVPPATGKTLQPKPNAVLFNPTPYSEPAIPIPTFPIPSPIHPIQPFPNPSQPPSPLLPFPNWERKKVAEKSGVKVQTGQKNILERMQQNLLAQWQLCYLKVMVMTPAIRLITENVQKTGSMTKIGCRAATGRQSERDK